MSDIPRHLVDKRVLERNLRKGLVDHKEFDRSLKDLDDKAPNAETVTLAPSADDGPDDDED